MIKVNQVTKTHLAMRYNGRPVGEFRNMSPGGWVFIPHSSTVYSVPVLREITERLAKLVIEGAS